MEEDKKLQELAPPPATSGFGADHVAFGVPIPKQKRLEMLEPAEWEAFVEEWGQSLQPAYFSVRRHSGAGDKGLDVIGLLSSDQLADGYDNFQCKRYDHPLTPSDVWVEMGKLIFYTGRGDFPPPRYFYFAAPKGVGTKLQKLLGQAASLKAGLKQNWTLHCQKAITSATEVSLDGELLKHFESFDFSIFRSLSGAQLIEGHSQTPFHSVRFGGGLPVRPELEVPEEILPGETRFTEQLMEAYSDNAKTELSRELLAGTRYEADYKRQRERFYSAEALRNFARDSVPPGTFEDLQNQALDAVFDVCQASHACGLTRMRAALNQASSATFSSSPLISRIREQDKKGFCHQLANEDKLTWVP